MTPTRHCVAAGQLLTLPARAGQLARCASGVLWLTAGDGDVVLRPGDSYPVPADGPLLVEAADQGVLLLETPNPQARRRPTAAKIATPHNPAIIYKPGDGVVSSGLAYVAVRACQAVVC